MDVGDNFRRRAGWRPVSGDRCHSVTSRLLCRVHFLPAGERFREDTRDRYGKARRASSWSVLCADLTGLQSEVYIALPSKRGPHPTQWMPVLCENGRGGEISPLCLSLSLNVNAVAYGVRYRPDLTRVRPPCFSD